MAKNGRCRMPIWRPSGVFIEEQWLPESDPRALNHVRRLIREEGQQPTLDGVGEFAAEWIARLKWILERNGATAVGMWRKNNRANGQALKSPYPQAMAVLPVKRV